jgi:hypothetical protein
MDVQEPPYVDAIQTSESPNGDQANTPTPELL